DGVAARDGEDREERHPRGHHEEQDQMADRDGHTGGGVGGVHTAAPALLADGAAVPRALADWASLASKSARNLVMNPSIGHAAASPSAQMVLPPMPLATFAISSMSPGSPSPRATRLHTRASQPEPSRQGVHCPHDSCA